MSIEYAIAALIPEPFRSQLETLRRQYDQWSKSWLPPHITIVPPIHDAPQRLVEAATSLCYPIDVTFGGWFAFRNPKGHVVWLDPGQTSSAEAQARLLHDYPELQAAIDSRRYHGSFTFHISVVERIPSDQFATARKAINQHHIDGTCRIERLTLYRREIPNGEWQEQKT